MQWQDLFLSKTIRRGESLLRAGRVIKVDLVSAGTYEASVLDDEYHTVRIRNLDGIPEGLSCSCEASAACGACAHMAAVFSYLEQTRAKVAVRSRPLSYLQEIYPFESRDSSSYFRFSSITRPIRIVYGVFRQAGRLLETESLLPPSLSVSYSDGEKTYPDQVLRAETYIRENGAKVRLSCTRTQLVRLSCEDPACRALFQTDLFSPEEKPVCPHQVALLLQVDRFLRKQPMGDWTNLSTRKLVDAFWKDPVFSSSFHPQPVYLLPRLVIQNRKLFLGFRIHCPSDQKKRPVVIRSLSEFVRAKVSLGSFPYGSDRRVIDFSKAIFDLRSYPFFHLLRDMLAHRSIRPGIAEVPLNGLHLDVFFDLCSGREVECLNRDSTLAGRSVFLTETLPDLSLRISPVPSVSGKPHSASGTSPPKAILLSGQLPVIIQGMGRTYLLADSRLAAVDNQPDQAFSAGSLLSILDKVASDGHLSLLFGKDNLPFFTYHLLPALRSFFRIEETDPGRIRSLLPPPASFRIHLDLDGHIPTARIEVSYRDRLFRLPEDICLPEDPCVIPSEGRDLFLERQVIDQVRCFLPRVLPDTFACEDDPDTIFLFFRDGLDELRRIAPCSATETFRRIRIFPAVPYEVFIQRKDGTLFLSLSATGLHANEITMLIRDFRMGKPYFRQENGSFFLLKEDTARICEVLVLLQTDMDHLPHGPFAVPLERLWAVDLLLNGFLPGYRKSSQVQALLDRLQPYHGEEVLSWLMTRVRLGLPVLLADETNIGRHHSVIELLQELYSQAPLPSHRPSLILCPSSLAETWNAECQQLAPALRILAIAGEEEVRARLWKRSSASDVVVCSFPVLQKDLSFCCHQDFICKIVDGFALLGTPGSATARAALSVRADSVLVLTDPSHLHALDDLESLFRFLMPGFPLACLPERFRDYLSPFLLSRQRSEVPSLPVMIRRTFFLRMEQDQQEECDKLSSHIRLLLGKSSTETFDKDRIRILANLNCLRAALTDPESLPYVYRGSSCKRRALNEFIPLIVRGGRKVLILSSYPELLSRIRKDLAASHLPCAGLVTFENALQKEISVHPDIVVCCDLPPDLPVLVQNLDLSPGAVFYALIVRDSLEEKLLGMQEQYPSLVREILEGRYREETNMTPDSLQALFL